LTLVLTPLTGSLCVDARPSHLRYDQYQAEQSYSLRNDGYRPCPAFHNARWFAMPAPRRRRDVWSDAPTLETGRDGSGSPRWPLREQFTDLRSFGKGVIWLSIGLITEIPPGVSTPRSYVRCNSLLPIYIAGPPHPEPERYGFSFGPFNDVIGADSASKTRSTRCRTCLLVGRGEVQHLHALL
jgi:hypothetical protein